MQKMPRNIHGHSHSSEVFAPKQGRSSLVRKKDPRILNACIWVIGAYFCHNAYVHKCWVYFYSELYMAQINTTPYFCSP